MDKIIQFKKVNREKIKTQYELDGCDDELVDLAEKLIRCNPAARADKKKDEVRAEYLKKAAQYRAESRSALSQELSEDELDSAAGGLATHYEDKDPFKDR